MQGLQDPHAKVRWAACQALGQMCTDLGPNIQEEQHQNILPGLMAVMDDFGEPRVQVGIICKAACAVRQGKGATTPTLQQRTSTYMSCVFGTLRCDCGCGVHLPLHSPHAASDSLPAATASIWHAMSKIRLATLLPCCHPVPSAPLCTE